MQTPMPALQVFQTHASFCSVMANATRLRIMWLLRQGESSVTQLAQALGVSVSNVSQHLRIMRDKGALTTRKQGQTVFCRIANDKFTAGLSLIMQGLEEQTVKSAQELAP